MMTHYEQVAEDARIECSAKGVILMVYDGDCANGIAIRMPPEKVAEIPAVLRQMADQIEEQTKSPETS
jgi:hypothetical protein